MRSEARIYIYQKYKRAFHVTVLAEGYHDKSTRILNSNGRNKKQWTIPDKVSQDCKVGKLSASSSILCGLSLCAMRIQARDHPGFQSLLQRYRHSHVAA
jgi:hypothetical protein